MSSPASTPQPAPSRPRIIVIGGGFGGLWAVRALERADVDVILIDRRNHHLFQPLLYQVATAALAAPDIAAPLRQILRRQKNVTVLNDEVRSIDTVSRTIETRSERLQYDFLVVASGASHSYFGHDDWAGDAPGLKTLEHALDLRRRILTAFERAELESDPVSRTDWLRFAIVGGGPTGVELAGSVVEIARHTLRGEFRRIRPETAEVHLIEAGPRLLAGMREASSESARRQLEAMGVRVHTGTPVTAIDSRGVDFGGHRLACRTVIWAAGVQASPLGATLGQERDRQGRLPVSPDLTLPGHPEVFVIGDLACVAQGAGRGTGGQSPAGTVPGVAAAAKQMGRYVGLAIRARLAGREPSAFRYRDYGTLATIGRKAAVVDIGPFRMSGRVAWWFWLTAHLFFLIGFRNRLAVMLNWALSYYSRQRYARIIVSDES
jgi:NADH:ubiquinone reductase (H+-translocating)